MKKKWWIILIIFVVIFLLLWLGAYLLYQNLDNNAPYGPTEWNRYFCGVVDGWECPQRFLEENGFTYSGVITELPEWWEQAGCVKKTTNIYCKDYRN